VIPVPLSLLPDNASVSADGRLAIAGCDLVDLAATHGTPLFVYDEDHLRARCREAVAAFGAGNVVYASKAFLCLAMARLAHEEGLLLDVASEGELHVASAAGVPAERLVLHGNNKSMAELRRGRREGLHHIVIDSFDELERHERLHAEDGLRPPVLVRVTPGIEAHTHEYVRTGHNDSKFGFGMASGAANEAVRRVGASPAVELVGVHAHIASQVFAIESFEAEVDVLAPFVQRHGLPELVLGGGLGVAYVAGETAPSLTEWGKAIREACAQHAITARVSVEPGRSIVAAAGVTLYEVGTIKDLPGIRTYVSVDGGMSDNPRPVLYGSGYEAFLPRAVRAERERAARIVGKHCESGDVLLFEAALPADLAVGDILATPVTGAYGYAMASNYNKVPRPAVVFVRDGAARVVVRRETLDDLLRCDV